MDTYTTSLDMFAKIITGFLFIMVIAGIFISFSFYPWYGGLCVSVIPAILIFCFYPYRVASYQVTDEKLIIVRPFTSLNKEILLLDIESISLLNSDDFRGTIRTFGNGGLFGYSGYFSNSKLGTFMMYAANSRNKVVIAVKNHKYKIVISPDDTGLVSDVMKRLRAKS